MGAVVEYRIGCDTVPYLAHKANIWIEFVLFVEFSG